MKKFICLLNILLITTLVACVEEDYVIPEDNTESTPDVKPEDNTESTPEEDEEDDTESTPEEDEEETIILPSDYNNFEIMELLIAELSKQDNYLKSTKGTSETISGVEVVQQIENNTYVYPNYVYAHYSSDSSVVSFNHKVLLYPNIINYSHGSKYSSAKFYLNTSVADYTNKYGLLANSEDFMGYIINEETILEYSYKEEGNEYIFEYELDLDKSSASMKVQMKEFGGLEALPVFEQIKITIYMDKDFNISKIETFEIYNTVKKVLFVNVPTKLEQNLTTTFTKFDDTVVLPNLEDYL